MAWASWLENRVAAACEQEPGLTFAARLELPEASDRRIVVKVAPPGLAPVRNRDVLRQARLLRALAGVDGVCVPQVLLEDAGSPPFFVMDFVEGESYEPKLSTAAWRWISVSRKSGSCSVK